MMAGRRASPLWMLLPIALLIVGWAGAWWHFSHALEREIVPLLPAGTHYRLTGFPYRFELETGPVAMRWRTAGVAARLGAAEMIVGRRPLEAGHHVFSFERPAVAFGVAPARGQALALGIGAARAQASLARRKGIIARLSVVATGAHIAAGPLPPAVADEFSFHLRETPTAATPPDDPRPPAAAEFRMDATGWRFGAGAPLAMEGAGSVTAAARLRTLAVWEAGGTVEIRNLVLRDAHAEVARLAATIAETDAGLMVAGTIETRCPAAVRAAFAGVAPAPRQRLRRPVRIAFSGVLPGPVALDPPTVDEGGRVLGQEPPCPRLR